MNELEESQLLNRKIITLISQINSIKRNKLIKNRKELIKNMNIRYNLLINRREERFRSFERENNNIFSINEIMWQEAEYDEKLMETESMQEIFSRIESTTEQMDILSVDLKEEYNREYNRVMSKTIANSKW